MKLGIIGTGNIVQSFLPIVKELDVEKVVLLSTCKSKTKADFLAQEYKLDGVYTSYETLLISDIDTVYVALPNHLHYEFSKKALLKGKHVIIEKPITSNSRELKELIELARERRLLIFEAVNLHYLPIFQELKKYISSIGKIKIVNFNYTQYSSRYDAFKQGEILPAFDVHKSGGALMDINVYNINALVCLFGLPKTYTYHGNVEKGIDTSGVLVVDYPEFKAVCIGAKDCDGQSISTIQGDNGLILIKGPISQINEFEVVYHDKTSKVIKIEQGHRLSYEFKYFIDMINKQDYEGSLKMLELSYEISKLMEFSRLDQGIVFDNDR